MESALESAPPESGGVARSAGVVPKPTTCKIAGLEPPPRDRVAITLHSYRLPHLRKAPRSTLSLCYPNG